MEDWGRVWDWACAEQKARRAAQRRVLRLRRCHTESRPVQFTQYRHHRKRLRPYPQHLRHLSRHYRESLVDLDYHPDIHLTMIVFG